MNVGFGIFRTFNKQNHFKPYKTPWLANLDLKSFSCRYASTMTSEGDSGFQKKKKSVPTVSSLNDFELNLPNFIDAGTQLSLLSDFDGTLAQIADNPQDTMMSSEVRYLMQKIARCPNIFFAIITGRAIDNIQEKINLKNESITYAGNHGLEIKTADGDRHDYKLSEEMQKSFQRLVTELNEKACINNAWVENKRVSLTYHFRNTPPAMKDEQIQIATKIIESAGYRAQPAHDAVDAMPMVNCHKGKASQFVLKHRFGQDWANCTKVIYVGDDCSDENAMKDLQGIGKTFRISVDPDMETYADFLLPSQEVVVDLLKWITKVYKL